MGSPDSERIPSPVNLASMPLQRTGSSLPCTDTALASTQGCSLPPYLAELEPTAVSWPTAHLLPGTLVSPAPYHNPTYSQLPQPTGRHSHWDDSTAPIWLGRMPWDLRRASLAQIRLASFLLPTGQAPGGGQERAGPCPVHLGMPSAAPRSECGAHH